MTASLRALLANSVDYAGLFPPANLALEPALRNHAEYVHSADAWMLGAFVLPLAKFDDVEVDLRGFDVDHPLEISALGSKTDSPSDFITVLETAASAVGRFAAHHAAFVRVNQLEIPLATQPGATIAEASEILAEIRVPVFWEAPADDAERTIATLAEHRARGAAQFGYKLRTGGVVASAFPSSMQIARALIASIEHRVPIKFTAGLHHPVRQFHTSVQTKMHGFLNVFGAGVLAAQHGWGPPETAAMLEDEDSTLFEFTDEFFAWREWRVTIDRIREHRALITSFGSCSFDEPRDDLRALRLF